MAPTFHGDTIYGETTVLGKRLKSKPDRGIVQVETRGYNQDGTLVCVFRRKVMVPTETYIKERGGEQPGRPSRPPEPHRQQIRSRAMARLAQTEGLTESSRTSSPRCGTSSTRRSSRSRPNWSTGTSTPPRSWRE